MKILHITGHLGGGIGTTLLGWMEADPSHTYWVHSLDTINCRAELRMREMEHCSFSSGPATGQTWDNMVNSADVVVVHWWDNPFLSDWIQARMPACRMVFWAHQNYNMDPSIKHYPDRFIVTSPVMGGQYDCIKSTGDISRFLSLKHYERHEYVVGYVGTVDYKKLHIDFIPMGLRVDIPDVVFSVCGENHIIDTSREIAEKARFRFHGKIANVEDFYSIFNVFGYPLRPDHYGTSELVLGEAMASGLTPICMDNPAERLIIKNGVTGYLCASEEEYIENIEHLYHKPLLRKWMGDNARQAAVEMYDIKRMVKEWNEVFTEMMDTQLKVERNPVKLEKV